NPSYGALSDFDADSGEIVYTPETGYIGFDSFSFGVNDGELDSSVGTISIHIGEEVDENNAPVPEDQSVDTDEDTSVDIILEAFDIDSDDLTFTVVDQPQHGTLEGSAPNLVYTPFANYAGPDDFTYSVDDRGQESADLGTVEITIAAANDLPVALDKSVKFNENSQKTIILSASDVDGDALSYAIVSNPQHGTLTGNAPILSYWADEGYTGHDSFKFVASDAVADSNVAKVSIRIVPSDAEDYDDVTNDESSYGYGNAAPLANSQSIPGTEDTPIHVSLSASDADYDILAFVIIDYPLHGNLSGFDAELGTLTYTPSAEYSGPDRFTFKASDDYEDSETAIISFNITAVNDPP
ncbi:MAG: Ig-like domain-containing protein, partial [Nitrososphaerales archaeon]